MAGISIMAEEADERIVAAPLDNPIPGPFDSVAHITPLRDEVF
jgi:hypothetical protein